MRDFRKEKIVMRSRMRTIRGIIRRYRAMLKTSIGGCQGCKGNALKSAVMQHTALQKLYDKIISDENTTIPPGK